MAILQIYHILHARKASHSKLKNETRPYE
jgi:hypothetical protein